MQKCKIFNWLNDRKLVYKSYLKYLVYWTLAQPNKNLLPLWVIHRARVTY